MQTAYRVYCPAKLNLSLRVLGKRGDGYHTLSSLFAYCGWYDRLTLRPDGPGQGQITIEQSGAQALGDLEPDDNLVVKAYHFACDHLGVLPSVHVQIDKNIPSGAGLGGGSSDAAGMLRWALDYLGLALPRAGTPLVEHMRQVLGADTYPILEGRARLWSGTGDVPGALLTLNHPLHVLVVFPEEHVSTGSIFANVKAYSPDIASNADLWDEALNGPNDLQRPAVEASTTLGPLLDSLARACQQTGNAAENALKVQMSGSGSACFALFNSRQRALEAAQHPDLVQCPQFVGPLLVNAWEAGCP